MKHWRDRAACKGVDPDLFFPRRGDGIGKQHAVIKEYCEQCPVRRQCLEVGLREIKGIWGGKTVEERRELRKRKERSNIRLIPPSISLIDILEKIGVDT